MKVYALYRQKSANATALKEEDAHPADPEPGYGWEKLFTEQMCSYYWKDYKFETRIVRFHSLWAPGHIRGRKRESTRCDFAESRACAGWWRTRSLGRWATDRSFMYVDDCVEGLRRLMASDYREPLNLGTDELITVDGLVDLISTIAGKTLTKVHDLSKPQGVRGRNSDNSRLRQVLGWEPSIALSNGFVSTYRWIEAQVSERHMKYAVQVG